MPQIPSMYLENLYSPHARNLSETNKWELFLVRVFKHGLHTSNIYEAVLPELQILFRILQPLFLISVTRGPHK
jgi:hypothetical protein